MDSVTLFCIIALAFFAILMGTFIVMVGNVARENRKIGVSFKDFYLGMPQYQRKRKEYYGLQGATGIRGVAGINGMTGIRGDTGLHGYTGTAGRPEAPRGHQVWM